MSVLKTLQRAAGTNDSENTHARHAARERADAPVTAPSCRSGTPASGAELPTFATEERARAMLRSSSYGPVRHVACEVRQRVLVLRGRVPSFYLKQVVQTVVRDLLSDGLVIDNQVEVDRTERTCHAEEMECLF